MLWYPRMVVYALIVYMCSFGCVSENSIRLTFPQDGEDKFPFSDAWDISITDLQVAYSANDRSVLIGRGCFDVRRTALNIVRFEVLLVVDIVGNMEPGWNLGDAVVTAYVGSPIPEYYWTVACKVNNNVSDRIVNVEGEGDVLVRCFPYSYAPDSTAGNGLILRPVELAKVCKPRTGRIEVNVKLDIEQTWVTWIEFRSMQIDNYGHVIPKVHEK